MRALARAAGGNALEGNRAEKSKAPSGGCEESSAAR